MDDAELALRLWSYGRRKRYEARVMAQEIAGMLFGSGDTTEEAPAPSFAPTRLPAPSNDVRALAAMGAPPPDPGRAMSAGDFWKAQQEARARFRVQHVR